MHKMATLGLEVGLRTPAEHIGDGRGTLTFTPLGVAV